MHPVMVVVSFTAAALVVYVVVLAALTATSVLPREGPPDDSRDDRAPVPEITSRLPA